MAETTDHERANRQESLARNIVEDGQEVCRFCDEYVFAWTTTPEGHTPATWHDTAKCVEGPDDPFNTQQ